MSKNIQPEETEYKFCAHCKKAIIPTKDGDNTKCPKCEGKTTFAMVVAFLSIFKCIACGETYSTKCLHITSRCKCGNKNCSLTFTKVMENALKAIFNAIIDYESNKVTEKDEDLENKVYERIDKLHAMLEAGPHSGGIEPPKQQMKIKEKIVEVPVKVDLSTEIELLDKQIVVIDGQIDALMKARIALMEIKYNLEAK